MWDFFYGDNKNKKNKKKKKQEKIDFSKTKKKKLILQEEHTKVFMAKTKDNNISPPKTTLKTQKKENLSTPANLSSKTSDTKNFDPVFFKIISFLKEELGEAYSASFFSKKTTSTIFFNDNIEVFKSIYLSNIVNKTNSLLLENDFQPINNFMFMDINNKQILFIMQLDAYYLYLILNNEQLNLGYLINILLPKIQSETINIKK